MTRQKYKPGQGWQSYLIVPVHEHKTGIRVHQRGIYRTPSGYLKAIPCKELSKYIRICGGNRNRAVMAWAKDEVINKIN